MRSCGRPLIDGAAVPGEPLTDLFGGLVPHEVLGILVPDVDPRLDVVGELLDAAEVGVGESGVGLDGRVDIVVVDPSPAMVRDVLPTTHPPATPRWMRPSFFTSTWTSSPGRSVWIRRITCPLGRSIQAMRFIPARTRTRWTVEAGTSRTLEIRAGPSSRLRRRRRRRILASTFAGVRCGHRRERLERSSSPSGPSSWNATNTWSPSCVRPPSRRPHGRWDDQQRCVRPATSDRERSAAS